MTRCPYRADKECINKLRRDARNCMPCLSGQIADNTDLIYSAIMSLSADKLENKAEASMEERLCREKQK